MEKSPEAFRTISEVADFLDTPAHVLRFWESRFPQIRPVKRAGGRRYYRPSDVALLAGIKKLLHDDGLTIRGVQKILREHGIRHVAALGSGDDPSLLPAVDADTVLPPDFTMIDRLTRTAAPEATQSAQIISLETALGRGEAARSAEPELPWPEAVEDGPAAGTEGQPWPHDPNGPQSGDAVVEEAPFVAVEEATDDAPEAVIIDASPAAVPGPVEEAVADPAPDGTEPSPEGADMVADESGSEITAPAEQIAEPVAPESAGAEAPARVDTAPAAPTVEDVTVAALLRRADAAHLAPVRGELEALRDRLILLRSRVAEAARRRAK